YYKCDDSENLANYTEGGYHPIHIGDVISNCSDCSKARYRVIYKLGYNEYSTEWLGQCMDGSMRYVTLNIGEARLGQRRNELSVIESAASPSAPTQGCENIVRLLDHFDLIGPNGSHTVFVSELMWSIDHRDVRAMWDSRILSYQCFLALRYLHRRGFVHGSK
ncbi:hypothetical protein SISSUDRAFT_964199, partial [Sistotremastrum suecicum HHB10207 ss-3]